MAKAANVTQIRVRFAVLCRYFDNILPKTKTLTDVTNQVKI